MSNPLPSIDPTELEAVTGGVSSSTGDSSAVTAALQSLMSSIKDIATNQAGNGGSFMQMLPMMMMAMSNRGGGSSTQVVASAPPAVYAPPPAPAFSASVRVRA